MAGPMFLLGIHRYTYVLAYLVGLVPLVGPLAIFTFTVFLGVKGREMAMASPVFTNRDQYVGFMKAIDHGGKIMFFVTLGFILLIVALLFFVQGTFFIGRHW